MPRDPAPVHPRVKDSKAYDADLRAAVLNPLFRDLREGMAEAVALTQVYRAMDAAVEAQAVKGVPIALIRKALSRIDSYHKQRMFKAFRNALGIDIRPLLTDAAIRSFMERRIAENVALIKTIPPRMHESLRKRVTEEFQDRPFDRFRLTNLLREEYKSTGYNLRRIARDQSNKMVGQLSEVRQRGLGIEGYKWLTAGDSRVRATHVANNGNFYRWDAPPPTGPPGFEIQCRCVAIAAVTKQARERLAEMTQALS